MKRTLALLALVAALVLGACSDDDGGDADAAGEETTEGAESTDTTDSGSTASEPPDTAGEAGEGECAWLDASVLDAALGATFEEIAAGESGCSFETADDGPRVLVNRTEIAIDPGEYAEGTRDLCDGEVREIDAGDEAFACEYIGVQGFVFEGQVTILVQIDDAPDTATALDALEEILPEVRVS